MRNPFSRGMAIHRLFISPPNGKLNPMDGDESRQRKMLPRPFHATLAESPGLRGVLGNFDAGTGNPNETNVFFGEIRQLFEFPGFAVQPVPQPQQFIEKLGNFTCRRRMHFDPNRAFPSVLWLVAEAVIPTRFTGISRLLCQGRVQKDAPGQPP